VVPKVGAHIGGDDKVMQFLVINARRYDFAPKDAKEGDANIKGMNLEVLEVGAEVDNRKDSRGLEVMKVPAHDDCWGQLKSIPGIYDAAVSIKRGKEGKASVKVMGLELVSAVDLGQMEAAKK
jgi:hypothetical protein